MQRQFPQRGMNSKRGQATYLILTPNIFEMKLNSAKTQISSTIFPTCSSNYSDPRSIDTCVLWKKVGRNQQSPYSTSLEGGLSRRQNSNWRAIHPRLLFDKRAQASGTNTRYSVIDSKTERRRNSLSSLGGIVCLHPPPHALKHPEEQCYYTTRSIRTNKTKSRRDENPTLRF